MLTLPNYQSGGSVTLTEARAAWSAYLGGHERLLLVKSTDRARKLLMQAFGLETGEPVGIPANTRRPLSALPSSDSSSRILPAAASVTLMSVSTWTGASGVIVCVSMIYL